MDLTARGVTLECGSGAGSPVVGTVSFERPLFGEPYPLWGDTSASVDERDPLRVQVVLEPGAQNAGLMFPLAGTEVAVVASLSSSSAGSFRTEARLSAGGPEAPLDEVGTAASHCRLALPLTAGARSKGAVGLDPEAVDQLRALGCAD